MPKSTTTRLVLVSALALATLVVLALVLLTAADPVAAQEGARGDNAQEGILVCFPWYSLGCDNCSQCPGSTLYVRACQVCSSSGCSFLYYETKCQGPAC